ncbi:MAG: 4Fe-4S dicluster domain-containing protein [Bacteroidota bacterium]
MPSKQTSKSTLQKIGLGLFGLALVFFTLMLGLDSYELNQEKLETFLSSNLGQNSEWQIQALQQEFAEMSPEERSFVSTFSFQKGIKTLWTQVNERIETRIEAEGVPEGLQSWQVKIPSWLTADKSRKVSLTSEAAIGPVTDRPLLWLFLTFGLGIIGGLLYIIPKFRQPPGIKHDHIYHNSLTRGLHFGWRAFFLSVTTIGVLTYGITYMNEKWMWPAISTGVGLLIFGLAFLSDWGRLRHPAKSASPGEWTGWLGIVAGIYFISFYILLYWMPQHIVAWVKMVDPVSRALSGGGASQWFLYGLMYTVIVAVMGVRMFAKYQHNKYQQIRTASVIFFQTAFAFLIPEILVSLNQPWMDLKNIWPLDYDFLEQWQVNQLWNAGSLGKAMLFWGIGLIIIGVPLMVHLVGKRWYCSWVCGCGGLAETMGDPWRQLSDKSIRAWRVERWLIHLVLVFAVIMTVGVVYSYLPKQEYWLNRTSFLLLIITLLTGAMGYAWYRYRAGKVDISQTGMYVALSVTLLLVGALGYRIGAGGDTLLLIDNGTTKQWYGFLIGAGFAGVVGTGFYPLMGNRVWCRFGCPLAAYLGLVQRFQSRFRITTNGGQCISCGNCSTYCEMGIDVRHYAQRGQDIVRSSCVGCGVCAAVCPRGVLRLENGSGDVGVRTQALRTIHISEEDIRIFEPVEEGLMA